MQSSRSKSTTCPRQGRLLRFKLSKERASAQIQIEQRSDFRWLRSKAWKQCQVWFWIDSNQSLQPNQLQMKCYVWKPCSDQRWHDKRQFSIWAICLCERSSTLLLTNHPYLDLEDLYYISSYQFSLFLGLSVARWALSANCARWKYFNSNLCWMW